MVDELMGKAKVSPKEIVRNVSRSGEKGRTASFWLVGESRLLYVRTKESMQMVSFCSLKGKLEGFQSDVWLSQSCMIELC